MSSEVSLLSSRINIFNYLSPIDFLENLFQLEKRKNPAFTYEKWSELFGFKSRSFLKLIMTKKRRITPLFIEKFLNVYQLSHFEKEYFHFLILSSQTRESSEKKLFLSMLLEIKAKVHFSKTDFAQEEFLSSPEIPHIQALLTFSDFEKTPANIANILNMQDDKVSEILLELEKLGAAERETLTTWKSKCDFFRVKPEYGAKHLRRYHDFSLKQAIKAQDMSFELRRFKSFLVPLSSIEFERLLEQAQEFINKSLVEFGSSKLKSRRLYKVNFNLYPVSEQFVVSDDKFSNMKTKNGLHISSDIVEN